MQLNHGEVTLIKMVYDIPNATTGIDSIIVQVITAVPQFTYGLLFFLFFIIFLTGTTKQRNRLGYADYPFWAMVSIMPVFFVSLLMGIVTGFMTLSTFSIVIAITIMISIWFFLSSGRFEK